MISKVALVKPSISKPSQHHELIQSLDPILSKRARFFLKSAKADSTLRAYRADVQIFLAWCQLHQLDPVTITAESVMNFIADQAAGYLSCWHWLDKTAGIGELVDGAARKPSTLVRRLAGIRHALRSKGVFPLPMEHPDVKEMMRGIHRMGDNTVQKKDALTVNKLRVLLDQISRDTLTGKRDYALLLVMFNGALRRSEASTLDVQDLYFEPRGIRMKIKPSKHQLNFTEIALIPNHTYCVVSALQDYLHAAKLRSGALFRRANRWQGLSQARLGEQGINRIIKHYCRAIFPEGDFSGHSLRRGFITSSVEAGKPLNKIVEISRHKDIRTLKEYFDEKERFDNHAATDLFGI